MNSSSDKEKEDVTANDIRHNNGPGIKTRSKSKTTTTTSIEEICPNDGPGTRTRSKSRRTTTTTTTITSKKSQRNTRSNYSVLSNEGESVSPSAYTISRNPRHSSSSVAVASSSHNMNERRAASSSLCHSGARASVKRTKLSAYPNYGNKFMKLKGVPINTRTSDNVAKSSNFAMVDAQESSSTSATDVTPSPYITISHDPLQAIDRRILTIYEERERITRWTHFPPIKFTQASMYFRVNVGTDTFVHERLIPERTFYEFEENASLYLVNHFNHMRRPIDYNSCLNEHHQKLDRDFNSQHQRQLDSLQSQTNIPTNTNWVCRSFTIKCVDQCRNGESRVVFSTELQYSRSQHRFQCYDHTPNMDFLWDVGPSSFQRKIVNMCRVYIDKPIHKNTDAYLTFYDAGSFH